MHIIKKELASSEPVRWLADYPLNYGCILNKLLALAIGLKWREYRVNLAKRKYLYAMIVRLLIFLVVNFAALALGGLATKNGVSSDWYTQLNKAPWTPPGWVFGAAWTSIMICYSFYMAYAWECQTDKKQLLTLFIIQWFLNVLWNPVFFAYHLSVPSLAIIVTLTALIGYILFTQLGVLKVKSLLLAPYFIWLLIASSLNAYIVFKN